ncbi:MAG: hypothetical protein ACT4P7_06715 [Gemmatimonadaceae bacterium]
MKPLRASRSYWSDAELQSLVRLARSQASTRQIAYELKRTPKAIRNKASSMGLALTANDARRAARRHAKAAGEVDAATTPRRRRTLKITVDFDISSLTLDERRALAARLLEQSPAERELVIPKAYDASAAALERHERRREQLAANGKTKWDDDPPEPTRRQRRKLKKLKKLEKLTDWRQRMLHPPQPPVRDHLPDWEMDSATRDELVLGPFEDEDEAL